MKSFLSGLVQDARFAARSIVRARGLTATAIVTLALGVGANTAIFSVVHAVVLRPLPYPNPDRLVELFERRQADTPPGFRVSSLNYLSWAEQAQSFEALAAFRGTDVTLTDAGEPERLLGSLITASMFRVLGLSPVLGRPLRADDEKSGSPRVVVISESLWRRRFNADRAIVGQLITLNGERFQVVGIVPRAFREVGRSQIAGGNPAEVFLPLIIDPPSENRGNHVFRVAARLRPDISIDAARAEMSAIAARLEREFPASNKAWGVNIERVTDSMFDETTRPSLMLLLTTVGIVLLIACSNVANLLLAKGLSRQRELSLRVALGAARYRLVRQLITESICLATLGGMCGVIVAAAAMPTLKALLPPTLPRLDAIQMNSAVLGFGLIMSLLSGLAFGILPALRASRVDVLPALEGGRGAIKKTGAFLPQVVVVCQVALATTLLVSAMLLLQGFLRLQTIPLGFDADNVLTARISLPRAKYSDPLPFQERLIESLEAHPHVRGAAVGTSAPFAPGVRAGIRARKGKSDPGLSLTSHIVSGKYFEVLGIPILAGRSFDDQDRRGAPPVAVISRNAGDQLWPGTNPIGRVLELDGAQYQIVGIAGDIRGASGQGARGGALSSAPGAAAYLNASQSPQNAFTLVVKTASEPSAITESIRAAIREIDPTQPTDEARLLQDWVAESTAQPRLTTMLTLAFALTALLLAAVGIYGVLAYTVGQRTREIGLRMAVGAQGRQVIALVVRKGMTSAVAGIALGLLAAFASSRLIANLLFEVSARDPLTFTTAGLLLALIALVACYAPARRAAGVDPLVALRHE